MTDEAENSAAGQHGADHGRCDERMTCAGAERAANPGPQHEPETIFDGHSIKRACEIFTL